MPSIANYAVVVRRRTGEVETRQPSSLAFSYIASSVTITLGMLSTPMAQQALTTFALELDSILPRPASHTQYLDRACAGEFVRLFLRKLYTRFPVVVIDEQLADGGALGFIQRNGPEFDFDTRHHYIHVNAAVSRWCAPIYSRSPSPVCHLPIIQCRIHRLHSVRLTSARKCAR